MAFFLFLNMPELPSTHSKSRAVGQTLLDSYFGNWFALPAGESVRTELMVDPRSKALVLNGNPGHLQFYSLQRDKLLYNVRLRGGGGVQLFCLKAYAGS